MKYQSVAMKLWELVMQKWNRNLHWSYFLTCYNDEKFLLIHVKINTRSEHSPGYITFMLIECFMRLQVISSTPISPMPFFQISRHWKDIYRILTYSPTYLLFINIYFLYFRLSSRFSSNKINKTMLNLKGYLYIYFSILISLTHLKL